MKSQTRVSIVAVALIAAVVSCSNAEAGGNGWGWAKPLNKRMGLFYTSNRNANFSRSKHRTQTYHSSPYRHRTVVPTSRSVHTAPVIRSVPAPTTRVIVRSRNAGGTSVPATVAPTVRSAPETKATLPMLPLREGALPHQSTTNRFWQ